MFNKKSIFTLILGGAFAGIINGLLGSGGGLLIVPLLSSHLNLPTKQSHATALVIILPITIISSIIYLYLNNIKLSLCLPITVGVTIGGLVGSKLLTKLKSSQVIIIFSLLMIFASIKLLLG